MEASAAGASALLIARESAIAPGDGERLAALGTDAGEGPVAAAGVAEQVKLHAGRGRGARQRLRIAARIHAQAREQVQKRVQRLRRRTAL